jgi:hypothetical protein
MFYHVLIETTEKVGKRGTNGKTYFEFDLTSLAEIEQRVIGPYLSGKGFQFNGYFLKYDEIRRIAIKQTDKNSKQVTEYANNQVPRGVITLAAGREIGDFMTVPRSRPG